ncbi:MAG TPA: polysaccharide deacetylase family protein [Coriobacteriia bacterium]|jgi:peptidoglycan/xylan/chitin deacetylase (PgdA/CDA1 family)
MMRRHAPSLLAAILLAAVVLAAAAFAVRGLSTPRGRPAANTSSAPVPSVLTSSFSVVDTQAAAIKTVVTEPKRVYDKPQRGTGTQNRLQAHSAGFYVPPAEYLLSQGIVRVRDAGRRVAFTFDDGPSANTAGILRTLSRYDSHATFFEIGVRVEMAPDLCRAVLAQGSELGNHTMMHSELLGNTVQVDESDIMSADDVFYKVAGVHPVYVRPKGGQLDDNGITAIKDLHRVFAYWDVASMDTVSDFTSADIRDTVLEDVRPGSVVLFHETNPRTAAALPAIIEGLHRRGYKVQSLTELLAR